MPLWTLFLAGVVATLPALAVGWWRKMPPREQARDLAASWLAALAAMALAATLFARSRPLDAAPVWRWAASWALLAAPLAASLALRVRGRRSLPRALMLSALALVVVPLWLTSQLRGPRADWPVAEVLAVAVASSMTIGSAACLGWWSKRRRESREGRVSAAPGRDAVGGLLLVALGSLAACAEHGPRLELVLLDTATGEPTPARVELLDAAGRAFVPADALEVFADCGALPLHNWVPSSARWQAARSRRRQVPDPYTGGAVFYSGGTNLVQLPPGSYAVRATKGIEHRIARGEITLGREGVHRLHLPVERWSDLPRRGWYGADDHLHIPRPHPGLDPVIATWMQAEDLHVANLLQMGLARDVHITPQRRFGPRSVHRQGDTLVVSGQENPRTHVLGHSIILGAPRWIDFPRGYPLYDRFWRQAHAEGAVNGFAHWALGGAEEGLALWGHEGLLDFIEVLNLGLPFYQRWYEALSLGIRVGPTAGTDYPCLPGLPGRERFYARLDGPLTFEGWLAAVRAGRTFVTNGPLPELTVDGAGIGNELRLATARAVRVRGSVRFDPQRDEVEVLELVRAGEVVLAVEAARADQEAGELHLATELPVTESTWLALRVSGAKRGETPLDARALVESLMALERRSTATLLGGVPAGPLPRPSAAHTGAVFVTVEGTRPLAEQPRARRIVESWLDRLAELESRFADPRLPELAGFPGRGDGLDERDLRRHRQALLAAIEAARRHHAAR